LHLIPLSLTDNKINHAKIVIFIGILIVSLYIICGFI
jgi:hypothetical protein